MKDSLVKAARATKNDPQMSNILAARILAETVRTTLGPKGMDKILVDGQNNITITNDGATILREISSEHPVARMMSEIAQSQEDAAGDGTTSAVLLAGELLKNAQDLLEKQIHPTLIVRGYNAALHKALEALNTNSFEVDADPKVIKHIAITAMTGKGAEIHRQKLANVCVELSHRVPRLSPKKISYLEQSSEEVQTDVVYGVVTEKTKVHPNMPSLIEDAKIALLTCPIELRQPELDTKLTIQSPDQLQEFLNREESQLKALVAHLQGIGASAVFTTKGIDDLAQQYLAQAGIYAVRREKLSTLQQIAQGSGAKILQSIPDLMEGHLGRGKVTELHKQEQLYTALTQMPQTKSATVFVSAPTIHVSSEICRALDDAIGDINCVLEHKKIVGGAGAIEMQIAQTVSAYAKTLQGKEQFAVEAFASAIEVIPQTIAENAGLDAIDILTKLRASNHGEKPFGIDINKSDTLDAIEFGIIEPLHVKKHALISASEVAMMILRIDDIVFTEPMVDNQNSSE